MTETGLIAYGAGCTWWDSKDKVGLIPGEHGRAFGGLPCCPHCRSVLFETEEEKWFAGVDRYDAQEPGYRAMIDWSRGQCFPNYNALKTAYAAREIKP